MSALSNEERRLYAKNLASLQMRHLCWELDLWNECVREAEIKVARAKAIRALANRELKRRKRKEASA